VTATVLALAFDPAVGLIQRIRIGKRHVPRVGAVLGVLAMFLAAMTFAALHVIPSMITDIEGLGKKLPTYVKDFESWAEDNEEFNELNQKYDLTRQSLLRLRLRMQPSLRRSISRVS
jgi:predicted PurR-regulated permease PerM